MKNTMFFPMVLLKLVDWIMYQLLANSYYRAARKMRKYYANFNYNNNFYHRPQNQPNNSNNNNIFPNISKYNNVDRRRSEPITMVADFHGVLLRSPSFFPYFMLVAFEGGGIFRAFALLMSCTFLWALGYETRLRVMIFISFHGLKTKTMDSLSRSVLPKFYLENLNLLAHEVFASAESRVVVTSLPRVMVEGFLKEYMDVEEVLGSELETSGKCFTGFVSEQGLVVKHRALKERFGEQKPDIGLGTSSLHDQLLISLCKEGYVVNVKEQDKSSSVMPREKYPKPLVFHDGRLAFLPTPWLTLSMFLWLPLGIILAVLRLLTGFLPFKIGILMGCFLGVDITVKGPTNLAPSPPSDQKGILYVCNHRTLMDPVFLSLALAKPVTAVTYSLSKMSEIISTIKTVRLTRDRDRDGSTMKKLLEEGDLVVCPEGTTCREPYLLRFSPLFAELSDDIVPVAVDAKGTMFYGTTASGLKCLDPFFFLMNPRPSYSVNFLGKIPKHMTCGGAGRSSFEVANFIQSQLAEALGFECTALTRRDKYLMLAGNEGIVSDGKGKKP